MEGAGVCVVCVVWAPFFSNFANILRENAENTTSEAQIMPYTILKHSLINPEFQNLTTLAFVTEISGQAPGRLLFLFFGNF